jgi:hypothetical protein
MPGASAGDEQAAAVSNGNVLANRLAAAMVHHEPGWRLPRHTALARRYNVSPAEIENAVAELVSRHLIRRLPDGQLYRTSPAEYLIELEGVAGLGSILDPMGGDLACRSRQASWRRVPEDICWALGLTSADAAVCVVRLLWTVGGEPAASSTTYLPGDLAGPAGLGLSQTDPLPDHLSLLPLAFPEPPAPQALHIEMQPPPRWPWPSSSCTCCLPRSRSPWCSSAWSPGGWPGGARPGCPCPPRPGSPGSRT